MKNSIKNAFSAIILGCLLLPFATAMAAEELTEKGIKIRGAQGLEVDFKPFKKRYHTGESIKFDIKGNREFYLYLFNIDKETDKGVMFLPNKLDTGNKYSAEQGYTVPNKGVEFYADEAGVEGIIVVASTKWLQFDESKLRKKGDFMVGKAADVEKSLKSIKIREREPNDDLVVKYIALRILGSKIAD